MPDEEKTHMWRVSSPVQISADELKARLQRVTRRPSLTRDQIIRVALVAAENTEDEDLVHYLDMQNGIEAE